MATTAPLPVRVGLGLSPFDREDPDPGRLWALVETMEELGYDSIWLSDTATLGGWAPLPALAAIAARTERLKLGMSVLVLPPRNPVLLARELATIDVLSGGRLLPAGGLGLRLPRELAAMGVPADERVARTEEAIAIVKALWAGGPVDFHGRFWTLEGVVLRPRPVRAKLELWLGGDAPAALRRIGRMGDGWLAAGVAPGEFAALADVIRGAAADAGRTIDEDHYGATVVAARSEDEAPPLPRGGPASARRRPPQVAVGAAAVRALLDDYVAAGASKFVLVPAARDAGAWIRELHAEVVAPIEAETAAAAARAA